jgi:hypothetical protein
MKKFVVALVMALFLLGGLPVHADQLGLGGAWVEGDQSWGVHMNYDKDMGWHKNTKHLTFGLDPSMQLFYLHWTKTTNKEETVKDGYTGCYERCSPGMECVMICEPMPMYDDFQEWPTKKRTKKSYQNETVHSLIAGVGPKAYVEYGRFRLYGLGAVGYALQDGAEDDVAVIAQGGISCQFTKSFGMSLDHSEIWVTPNGDYDRFDVTSLNAVLWF